MSKACGIYLNVSELLSFTRSLFSLLLLQDKHAFMEITFIIKSLNIATLMYVCVLLSICNVVILIMKVILKCFQQDSGLKASERLCRNCTGRHTSSCDLSEIQAFDSYCHLMWDQFVCTQFIAAAVPSCHFKDKSLFKRWFPKHIKLVIWAD